MFVSKIVMAGGVLLLAGLTACSGGDTKSGPPASSLAPIPEKTTIVRPMGTAVTLKSSTGTDKPDPHLGPSQIEVVATKVVDPAKTGSQGVEKPAPGTRFVAVAFQFVDRMANPYKSALDDAAFVVDDHGHAYGYKPLAAVTVQPTLENVNVQPHATQNGYIVFQVPSQVKIVKTRWAMDLGTGQTAEWTLPVT